MMKHKLLMVLLACLGAWSAKGAESNAVAVDLQTDAVHYLDSGTVTFPLNWESGLMPAGITQATLTITGQRYSASATATKPTATISCSLFETPPNPFRADSLTVQLVLSSSDGTLAVTNTTSYELRAGTFGRERVLTCATTANAWRLYQPPKDVPFDSKWYSELQGNDLTWAAVSNLVTGVYTSPVTPLTGPGMPRGFIPLEKEVFPSGQYALRIWSGNDRMGDVRLDGVNGVLIIFR